MSVAVIGATGFIGASIVRVASANKSVHRVFAIARKPLPTELLTLPKVTEVVVADLEHWSSETLQTLKEGGVKGCIWCVGGPASSFPDITTAKQVNITLPLVAAVVFATHLSPRQSEGAFTAGPRASPFHFIYISVSGAERDNSIGLWYQSDTRKIKGKAEKDLLDFATRRERDGNDDFDVIVLRLGRVLPGGATPANIMTEAVSTSINVERLATVCTWFGLSGAGEGQGKAEDGGVVIENAEVLGEDWAEISSFKAMT